MRAWQPDRDVPENLKRPSAGRVAVLAMIPALLLLAILAASGLVGPYAAAGIAALQIGGTLWLVFRQRREPLGAAVPPPATSKLVPQEFLERLPDPVILLNGAREIVAVNRIARDVLGVGMLGRDLALSLRHPDVLEAVETVLSGVPSVIQEIILPVPVTRTFTLHAGVLDASDLRVGDLRLPADERSPRIVLVLRDETRAKRAEQSRADFVANATHELRSPLSALIGFIETLQGPASDDAPARERFLGVMQTEARRMARLVDDLMSLSRVEINEHVPPRERIDLRQILASVVDTLVVRAEKRQMSLLLDVPDDVPAVVGDMDQLTQVFHNLIDNAVKYARTGTVIRITASAVDRLPSTQTPGVSIAVSDEGDGIESIHIPRLTERFYRADEGRSRRLGGTGLGLAIVKHIIKRHRGRLSIDSSVGVGSTFTVFLPSLPGPRPVATDMPSDGLTDGPRGS